MQDSAGNKRVGGLEHTVRSRPEITSDFWRPDLGEICVVRLSKTGGITGYFEDCVIEERSKMAQR